MLLRTFFIRKVLWVFVFGFFCGRCYAQFFDSQIDFFKEEQKKAETKKEKNPQNKTAGCTNGCSPNIDIGDIQEKMGLMPPAANITEDDIKTFSSGQIAKAVYLFVDMDCKFCKPATRILEKFKQDHKDWFVKGYFIAGVDSVQKVFTMDLDVFKSKIPFTFDLTGSEAARFGINKVPTFVIYKDDKYYKISGQPDLDAVIGKIKK